MVRRGFPANLGIVTAMERKVVVAVKRCYLNFLLICLLFFIHWLKKIAFGDTAVCVAFTSSIELF
jgi:hypothetical protein